MYQGCEPEIFFRFGSGFVSFICWFGFAVRVLVSCVDDFGSGLVMFKIFKVRLWLGSAEFLIRSSRFGSVRFSTNTLLRKKIEMNQSK